MESIAVIIVHLFEGFGCDLRENRKYLFKTLHILPFICHIRALWLVNVVASTNQWVVFVLHHVIRSVSNGINVVSPTKLPVLFHQRSGFANFSLIYHHKIRPEMLSTSRSCSIDYHVACMSYICLLYIVSLTVIAYNRCVVLLNCWIKFQPVGDLIIKQVTCSGNVEFVYLSDSKNQLSVKKKAVVEGRFLTLWYT